MSRPIIGIFNSSSFGKYFPEHLDRLRRLGEVRHLSVPSKAPAAPIIAAALECNGLILSVTPVFSAEVLAGLPKLAVIARHGIGYDNVDVVAAAEHGIAVTNVEGKLERDTVAEMTLALIMAAVRYVPQGARAVADSRWADRAQFIGSELHGKTAGIIGLGNIGSRVAEILSRGLNMKVIANDPAITDAQATAFGARLVPLEELLTASDVVSINCSLTPTSRNLLNRAALSRLKSGVRIVNTSRAEVIDEEALREALIAGAVGAYATDVIVGEPVDGDHPLVKTPHVIVTPHLGGYTMECVKEMGNSVVTAMELVLGEGRIPERILNPQMRSRGVRPWH